MYIRWAYYSSLSTQLTRLLHRSAMTYVSGWADVLRYVNGRNLLVLHHLPKAQQSTASEETGPHTPPLEVINSATLPPMAIARPSKYLDSVDAELACLMQVLCEDGRAGQDDPKRHRAVHTRVTATLDTMQDADGPAAHREWPVSHKLRPYIP
jgi:hypothetical protein